MIINLIYIACIIVALFFVVDVYLYTKRWYVFLIFAIFLFSLWLEMRWMSNAYYKLDVDDFLWTIRDILWTIGMIFCMLCIKKHYPRKKSLERK